MLPYQAAALEFCIWTEFFATMATILISAYPEKAPPHYFTYLRTLTNSSRTFKNSVLAWYDITLATKLPAIAP